jgi:hypothetical protein
MQKAKESKHLEDKNQKIKSSKSTISSQMIISQNKLNKKLEASDNQMKVDIVKPLITSMSYYLDRENKILIQHYGPDLYDYSRELENIHFSFDYLKKHKIDSNTRTKMVDWIIEVLYAYNSDPQTFFLAIHIMDLYLLKSKVTLTNNDIHLVGIVSLYIASKMEDIIPLRMPHVKQKIGHNKFSEKEIKRQERLILETIGFDSIITTSTYDFIKTFIFDFCHNNREYINKLNINWIIDIFDTTAIYLAKLMAHSDEFTHYRYLIINYLGIA